MNQVMKKLPSLTATLILFIWLAPFSILMSGFRNEEPSLVVIANEKGSPANLTFRELKAVVQGDKQRWPDGTKIALAFMKTSTPIGSATAKKLLKMNGDQFNKHWLALVFQGKATAPMFFSSVSELENFVNSNPGAIGVIDAGFETKARVITIDNNKSL